MIWARAMYLLPPIVGKVCVYVCLFVRGCEQLQPSKQHNQHHHLLFP